MKHFARVILDEHKAVSFLNESIFPNQTLLETSNGRLVVEIALPRNLLDHEADEYSSRLADYMMEQGYDNFEIEISGNTTKINEFFDQDQVQELKIGSQLPYDIVEDLCIFMKQDPGFYRKTLYPALIDVQASVKKGGKYNKKSMLPVIETAIIQYIKKFNIKKRPAELLTDSEKMQCITKLLTNEVESLRKGEY